MKGQRNSIQRLVICSISIVVVTSLFYLPYYDYLAIKLVALAFFVFAIIELNKFLPDSLSFRYPIIAVLLGISTSVIVLFFQYTPIEFSQKFTSFLNLRFIFLILFVILSIDWIIKKKIALVFKNIFRTLFFLVYPGFLASYFFTMFRIDVYPILHVFVLVNVVFIADGLSYLCGKLLSPKKTYLPDHITNISRKTLVGYAGGMIFSLYFMFVMRFLVPALFPQPLLIFIIFSILVVASSFLGDLFESALKRTANTKDSGSIMLGRGGVLDSLDSFFFAAPTYYSLYSLAQLF